MKQKSLTVEHLEPVPEFEAGDIVKYEDDTWVKGLPRIENLYYALPAYITDLKAGDFVLVTEENKDVINNMNNWIDCFKFVLNADAVASASTR